MDSYIEVMGRMYHDYMLHKAVGNPVEESNMYKVRDMVLKMEAGSMVTVLLARPEGAES